MQPYLRPEGQQLRQGEAPPAGRPVSEANPLALLLAIAADPRNSWIGGPGKIVHGAESLPLLLGGLGRLFNQDRGWEVLKKYIDKGGTPQSLRKLLRERGFYEPDVNSVARLTREGTDLAAPGYGPHTNIPAVAEANERAARLRARYPEHTLDARLLIPSEQLGQLHHAEDAMRHGDVNKQSFASSTAGALSTHRGMVEEGGHPGTFSSIPSGAQGQAAYQAIASRMARLMDDPNFLSLREHYLPPPVSDQTFWAATSREPALGQWTSTKRYAFRPLHEVMSQYPEPSQAELARIREEITQRSIEAQMRQQRGLAPPRTLADEARNEMREAPGYPHQISDADMARLALARERGYSPAGRLARPRSFEAAENQRTSNLNRRADQRQNPPEEP